MEQTINTLTKLLDNFILPKFEEIMEYKLIPSHNGSYLRVEFWMDGTEPDIEEEIVDTIEGFLKYFNLGDARFEYGFTTGGEHFYDYR